MPELNVESPSLLHSSLKTCLRVCFAEEESQPSASSQKLSINVVLFGALAKDFNQAVNQGVGSLVKTILKS